MGLGILNIHMIQLCILSPCSIISEENNSFNFFSNEFNLSSILLTFVLSSLFSWTKLFIISSFYNSLGSSKILKSFIFSILILNPRFTQFFFLIYLNLFFSISFSISSYISSKESKNIEPFGDFVQLVKWKSAFEFTWIIVNIIIFWKIQIIIF